jgi:hypothetical protein
MPRPRKKKEKTNECPHCGQFFGGSGFTTHKRYCELKNRQEPPAPTTPPEPKPADKKADKETEDDNAKIYIFNELPQNKPPAAGWEKLGEALGNAVEKAANSELLQAILIPIIAGAVETAATDKKEEAGNLLLDPKDPKNDWVLLENYFKE